MTICKRRLSWFGHLLRLHPDTPARQSLKAFIKPWKRPIGRPKTTWLIKKTDATEMLKLRLVFGLSLIALYWTGTRSERKCAYKYQVIPGHTACLPRSPQVTEYGLKAGERELILNLHNDLRANVTPPASDMVKLAWDDEIEYLAQKWAENCVFTHEPGFLRGIPGRMPLGQNIGAGYASWDQLIRGWYSEVERFEYGKGSTNGKAIGHYTQIVWSETYAIGCGYAKCKNLRGYYVCNYGPAGNFGNLAKPYVKGPPDSQCPEKYRTNNLCDCGRVCESFNDLNVSTCECMCKYPLFQKGELCTVNCTLAEQNQKHYGCNWMKNKYPKTCEVHPNIYYMCPIMCNMCLEFLPDQAKGSAALIRTRGYWYLLSLALTFPLSLIL